MTNDTEPLTTRQQAIVDFVGRQSVAYHKHSGDAVTEDMVLAVREFGVPVEAFYDDEPGQAWLRAQVALVDARYAEFA